MKGRLHQFLYLRPLMNRLMRLPMMFPSPWSPSLRTLPPRRGRLTSGLMSMAKLTNTFFLLNGMSHIAHKAQPCSTSHPAFQVMVPHLKLSLRAGCSVRGVESLQFSEFVPEGFRMCLKRGCLLD